MKPTCAIDGCEQPVRYKSAGLCNAHYLRQNRYGRLEPLHKQFTDVEKQQIIDRYLAGESTYSIAKTFKLKSEKIRFWLSKWGIERRPVGFQKGQRPASYKGRRSDGYGYILIHMPEHPTADSHGYIREHRLVMERMLGRLLEPHEVVHHKDGNRANNALENLELMSNPDHTKHHSPRTGTGKGLVRCIECEEEVQHFAKDMCSRCYNRKAARRRRLSNPEKYRAKQQYYRDRKRGGPRAPKQTHCDECGKESDRFTQKRCPACYMRLRRSLDPEGTRIKQNAIQRAYRARKRAERANIDT